MFEYTRETWSDTVYSYDEWVKATQSKRKTMKNKRIMTDRQWNENSAGSAVCGCYSMRATLEAYSEYKLCGAY